MIVPGSVNPLLMAGGGDPLDEYGKIERSLRIRLSASGYLSRTFGAAGSAQKATFHFDVRRGKLGAEGHIYAVRVAAGQYLLIGFSATDNLIIFETTGVAGLLLQTNRVFRDTAAHYDITIQIDTTQAVAADRVKISVDDIQETSFSTATYPVLNHNLTYLGTSAYPHYFSWGGAPGVLGGADFQVSNFVKVDGQSLPPSTFGRRHPKTNQFRPFGKTVIKAVADAGGAQSFFLPFDDITSLTTLCADASSKGNNFTATNISLTAGNSYDSLIDTPTNNFCTLNALVPSQNNGHGAISNGGLTVKASQGSVSCHASGTQVIKFPAWFEMVSITGGWTIGGVGIRPTTAVLAVPSAMTTGAYYLPTGQKRINGTSTAYGATWTVNDVISVAVDPAAQTIEFFKNGASQGQISIAGMFATDVVAHGGFDDWGSTTTEFNFGQRTFVHTPTTGFKAQATKNLPMNGTVSASGAFTGNVSADGPLVLMNGCPETLTINGNAVTFGTHADRLANGFKLRTSSASYNASGSNTWTAAILSPSQKSYFRFQNAR